jgi:hypothetical protein
LGVAMGTRGPAPGNEMPQAAAHTITPDATTNPARSIPTAAALCSSSQQTRNDSALDIDQFKINSASSRKAKHVLMQIGQNPKVIRANENGELGFEGQPISGSNIKHLFSALFMARNKNVLNTTGMNEMI